MKTPTILEMLEAGVHFGHQSSRWHPKMKPFIFMERNGVHIIDLEKTQEQIKQISEQVADMVADRKIILFMTTKPQAREIVKQAAIDCDMPYLVGRWIGGFITNFVEIKKLLKKYISLKEQQESGELEHYTKKEQLNISKQLEKMEVSLGGLVSLTKIPDVLFIPSFQREKTAVTEANRVGIPIIAVCDTNANPTHAEYVISGNDDAIRSITLLVHTIRDAVLEGKKRAEAKEALIPKEAPVVLQSDSSDNITL